MLLHSVLSGRRPVRRAGLAAAAAIAVLACSAPAHAATVCAQPDHTVAFDGNVWASVYVGSTVYLGGEFLNAIVDGKLVPRQRLAAVDVRTGELLDWAPSANNIVRALAAAGPWLYVGGAFTGVSRQRHAYLANVDLRTGAVGPLQHSLAGQPYALTADAGGGRLYVGGRFSAVDGVPAANLAAFRLADGSLDTGFHGDADGKVNSLAHRGTRLYVAGGFTLLDGATGHSRLGAVNLTDGALDTGFRASAPYQPFAITLGPGAVYAGLAGPGGRVIRYGLDGTALWTTVLDGDVQAVAYLNGEVYAGGHFTRACPRPARTPTSWCPTTMVPHRKLAALHAATGELSSWNPAARGLHGTYTMAASAATGKLAAGGDLTVAGDSDTQLHFAQFSVA